MNLNKMSLQPEGLRAKIIKYESLSDKSVELEYQIEITSSLLKMKSWSTIRNYEEFECLHKQLVKKFDRTPYLPSRILFQLKDSEKKERAKLLENYINICIKHQEILNSLEFRLFIDIEPHMANFIHPAYIIKDIGLDNNFPLKCEYWDSENLLFVITASKIPKESGKLGKVFKSMTNWFSKDVSNKGHLYLLQERINSTLNYEPIDKLDFDDIPVTMTSSELMKQVSVGFQSGKVITYCVTDKNKLQRSIIFNSHKSCVRSVSCMESQGILISTGDDNSLMVNDLADENGYCYEEFSFNQHISAMTVYQKKNLLFLGEQGILHIYVGNSEKKMKKLQLLLTKSLRDKPIVSISVDNKEKYINVGYKDGCLEIYEIGRGFEGMPTLIRLWELYPELQKIAVMANNSVILVGHGKGIFSFVDVKEKSNYYSQLYHNEELTDFVVSEDKNCIISLGQDKRLRIMKFFKNMFVNKYPEDRRIKSFNLKEIESLSRPAIVAENKVSQLKIPKREVIRKDEDSDLSEDEDVLFGWND